MNIQINSEHSSINSNILFVLGIITAGIFFKLRYDWLFSFEFPIAADSYFYLIEFKAYLTAGKAYFGKSPSFFFPISYLGKIFYMSELTLLHTVILLSLLMLSTAGGILCRSLKVAPLVAIIPWSSSLFFFNACSFPRQIFSLSLFMLSYALWLYCKNQQSHKSFASLACLCFMIFGMSMHLFVLILGFCILMLHILPKINGIFAALLTLLICLAGVLLIDRYSGKTTLALSGISWELGWLRATRFFQNPLAHIVEFSLNTIHWIILLTLTMWYGITRTNIWFFIFCWFVLNLPFWDLHSGMASRLALASPLFLYISSCLLIDSLPRKAGYSILLSLLVSFCIPFLFFNRFHSFIERPYAELSANHALLKEWIPPDALVLAPHGVQFGITYYLARRSERVPSERVPESQIFRVSQNNKPDNAICLPLPLTESIKLDEVSCFMLGKKWIIEKINHTEYKRFSSAIAEANKSLGLTVNEINE